METSRVGLISGQKCGSIYCISDKDTCLTAAFRYEFFKAKDRIIV